MSTINTQQTMSPLKNKISAWLNDKNNNENDLIDFLVDECGVVLEDGEMEEEDCECGNNKEKGLVNGEMRCEDCDIDGMNYEGGLTEDEEMEEEVVCGCVNHNEENWRESCDLEEPIVEDEEMECEKCGDIGVRCEGTGELCPDCSDEEEPIVEDEEKPTNDELVVLKNKIEELKQLGLTAEELYEFTMEEKDYGSVPFGVWREEEPIVAEKQ